MAEILLYVTDDARPDDAYQDGDIVCAFNDRRIRHVHAQMICDPRKEDFNSDGLRPLGGLGQHWFESTCEYRFERVNRHEVRRINLWTQETEVLGRTPNASGEAIDVTQYLARRLQNPKHQIFGAAGAEIWYGGGTAALDSTAVNAVWDRIETDTALLRDQHNLWPLTDRELQHFLAVPTLDMRDEITRRATAVELDYDRQQPEYDPENDIGDRIARKRRARVQWREMGLDPAAVLDPAVRMDLRTQVEPQDQSRLNVKPRIHTWTARAHLRPMGDTELFV